MDEHIEHLTRSIATAQDVDPADISVNAARRKRLAHSSTDEDVPWTTARCYRLLRSITCRLNILEKLTTAHRRRIFDTQPHEHASTITDRGHPHPLVLSTNLAVSPTKDPEWLPQTRTRRGHATYAGRVKNSKRPSTLNGPAATGSDTHGFPTPFRKRMLSREYDTSECHTEANDHEMVSVAAKRKQMQLPVMSVTSEDEACRNLIKAFEILLKQTSSPERILGTSSLMRTCLRKVPQYIGLEESHKSNDDDECDPAFEIYTELETLGTTPEPGWPGLREVVKAHAVSSISNAVRNGLLSDITTNALLKICNTLAALHEGRSLLLAWLVRKGTITAGSLDNYVKLRRSLVRPTMFLRMTAGLLDDNSLSPIDVDARWPFFHDLQCCISRRDSQATSIGFMESYIKAYCRQAPHTQTSPIFVKNMKTLTAMALIESDEIYGSKSDPNSTAQGMLSLTGLAALLPQDNCTVSTRCGVLLTSRLILLACSSPTDARGITLGITQVANIIDAALATQHDVSDPPHYGTHPAEFLFDVVEDCAMLLGQEAGDQILDRLIQGMIRSSMVIPGSAGAFLLRTSARAAMVYAEKHETRRSLALVDEIDDAISKRAQACTWETPLKASAIQQDKYRWEGGLCEWVVKTPALGVATISQEAERTTAQGAEIEFKHEPGTPLGTMVGSILESPDHGHELGLSRSSSLKRHFDTQIEGEDADDLALSLSVKKPRSQLSYRVQRTASQKPKPTPLNHQEMCVSDDELGF